MTAVWTLTSGTTTKTLAAWGIEKPRCVFRNLAADEFTFQIPTADAFAAPVFSYGQSITLKKDGTSWFIGTIQDPVITAAANREQHEYTALNTWEKLTRLTFEQIRCIKSLDFTALTSELTPRVILGQSSIGLRMSTSDVMFEVLQFANAHGAGVGGSCADGLSFPYEEASNLMCSEVLIRMARKTPDMVGWFAYGPFGATFQSARRGSLSSVTIDATAANKVTEIHIRARRDLQVAGVRITFVTSGQNTGGDNLAYTRLSVQEFGIPDQPGGVILIMETMGQGGDRPEQIPSTLAGDVYNMLSGLGYQGTVRVMEEECSGAYRPGKVLNISNAQTAWATMRALVQTTTEDLTSGITEITVGPAEHLAPQDFIEQLMWARRMALDTGLYKVRNCQTDPGPEGGDGPSGGPGDNPNAGKDPNGTKPQDGLHTKLLDLCVEGNLTTVSVYGP